tara:strand:- start:2253 stop:2648 length:396 start_codon:yes stop_codon:yes gene_type:complete
MPGRPFGAVSLLRSKAAQLRPVQDKTYVSRQAIPMKRLVFPVVLAAGPALADRDDGRGYIMDGYGIGMMFALPPWLIVLGIVVAGVIWFVRRTDANPTQRPGAAMTALDMRLARGQIDPEDCAACKTLLAS